MSRLPDLERALLDAATRLDAQASGSASLPRELARRRRWRRRGTPLLVALASLLVAGGAVAAVTGLLDHGDAVPKSRVASGLKPVAGTKGFSLASVRVPDPDGGPSWGIGTYDAIGTPPGARVPDDIARRFAEPVTCVVVGRIQDGQLGVVGRDGVFGNDGRFHPLTPASLSSSACGGRGKNGTFFGVSFGPPIPASGYTGPSGTPIGGCRERVNLNGPTVSPQTRRKLRDVPQCSTTGLRRVIAGFAGPRATSATLVASGYRKILKLEPRESGAYLFVLRSNSTAPPRLTITTRSGNTCEPFGTRPRSLETRPPPKQAACTDLSAATAAP